LNIGTLLASSSTQTLSANSRSNTAIWAPNGVVLRRRSKSKHEVGHNTWHGSAYDISVNKVLNANEYFTSIPVTEHQKNEPPPWSQNQYGFSSVTGDQEQNFLLHKLEQYRQRTGSPLLPQVPAAGMMNGDFRRCAAVSQTAYVIPRRALLRPLTVNQATGGASLMDSTQAIRVVRETAFQARNLAKRQPCWGPLLPCCYGPGPVNNFTSAAPSGGIPIIRRTRGPKHWDQYAPFGRFPITG